MNLNNIEPRNLDSVFHVLLTAFQNASFGIDLDYHLLVGPDFDTDLLAELGIFEEFNAKTDNDSINKLLALVNFIMLYSDQIRFEENVAPCTNGDRIRSMSDEELAEFILHYCDNSVSDLNEEICHFCENGYDGCKPVILKWLQQVKEASNGEDQTESS